jgi:hypothetical protein
MSLANPTNSDIMQALGNLQGQFSGIAERLDRADHSRELMYEKIDLQGRVVSDIGFAVKVAAEVAAQARDQVAAVAIDNNNRVEANKVEWQAGIRDIEAKLEPMITQWKKVDTIGKAVAALLTIGGVGFIAVAVWFGQLITTAVQHWLGITPPGP